jgi:hypothetical protein
LVAQRIDLRNLALFFSARNSVVLPNFTLIALSGVTKGFSLYFWHDLPVAIYARIAQIRFSAAQACKFFRRASHIATRSCGAKGGGRLGV